MRIMNKPRNLIGLVRHNRFVQKSGQGQIRQSHLGGNSLNRATRGNPGKLVSRPRRRRLGEQILQVPKTIRNAVDGVVQRHDFLSQAVTAAITSLMNRWMQSIMLALRSPKSADDSINSKSLAHRFQNNVESLLIR
jgi:hypothetical protein